MANGQKIMEALSETGNLTGCGADGGAADTLGHALRALCQVRDFDEELGGLCGQLEELEGLLNDFNRSLSDYMDGFHFDSQEMQQMEERLDLLNRLKAKYGKTLNDVLAYQKEKEERLQVLEHYEEYLAELREEYEKSSREIVRTCAKISEIRRRCAGELSQKITEALVDLNFLDVRFEIRFEKLDRPGELGMDSICFLISTNPGMPLRPLGDVASGGELSRIMLAIKAVMAEQDAVDTLIFDEIDTGISGRTAQKVSEKMAVIARNHQIICITHLAQIASMADQHFLIEKQPADGKTVTNIGLLSPEESITELARILGGAKITQAVIDTAREMKELASESKKY
jgi:DNA repair protein RecN (Recombination protein N)